MPSPLRLCHAIDRWNRRIGRGVAWLLLVMVLVGAYNAIARYVERDVGVQLSSNALLELQWYLFGIAFLFGAPDALRRGAHVRVDVLYAGLAERSRMRIDLWFTVLLLIPFSLAAVALSFDFVVDSWAGDEWSNDPGGLPRWPLKPAIPVAFVLLALQGTSEAIKRRAVLRGDATAHELGVGGGHDG